MNDKLSTDELARQYVEMEAELIQRGFFSARYFNKLSHILATENMNPTVTMQVFQRRDDQVLCGVDAVTRILSRCEGAEKLTVMAVPEGETVSANETVMTITGPFQSFAHLESAYLGRFARQTRVATNVRRLVEVANGKPILFMGDRFDSVGTQIDDGHAALVGGVTGICTDAHGFWDHNEAAGTMPHALIAACNGDTSRAAETYVRNYPDELATVLVDFENDCVKTTMEAAHRIGARLGAVRLDTSGSMIDESVRDYWAEKLNMSRELLDGRIMKGVTPELVHNVRNALDAGGFSHVKIIVSGGFNRDKIKAFEEAKTPVDMYGVGSSLIKGGEDFTADIVVVDGAPCGKVGRTLAPNPRMQEVRLG